MEWIVEAETREELVYGHWYVAEDLVRCRDCKYYESPWELDGMKFEGDCAFHDWYRASPTENDFCSYGERKDDV